MLAACGDDDPTGPESRIVRIAIQGDISDEHFGNLPENEFPFPQIENGSFEGWFSYSLEAAPLDSSGTRVSYPFEEVSICIRDTSGLLVHTITTSPNNLRLFPGSGSASLAFGPSAGNPGIPGDLRVTFTGVSTTTPPTGSELENATFSSGFLETDGTESATFWDLRVFAVSLEETNDTNGCP